MEIGQPIIKFISMYEDIFEKEKLKDMFEVWKTFDYEQVSYFQGDKLQNKKTVRNAQARGLSIEDSSKTIQHYSNLFHRTFTTNFHRYLKSNNFPIKAVEKLSNPEILKYEPGGHYIWHTDSCISVNRALSAIYFVNDDYEGGELEFNFPTTDQSLKIKPVANTMVVWPSNFMFPHRVIPVTKGIRYSVVCWAV